MLIAIPLVYSAEATSFFKYSEHAEVKRECFNDGALCGALFNCSLTVYDNNANVVFDNLEMNRTAAYYNVTIESLLDIGQYRSRMTCTDGSNSGSEIFYFDVTSSGEEDRKDLFLIMVLGSVILLTLAAIIKSNELGVFSGMLFLVSGVYTMIYGINGVYDLYSRSIAGVVIGLGMMLIIMSAYDMLTD